MLRKNKRLWWQGSERLEVIFKGSNDRTLGEVITDKNDYSTDYVMRQIELGFARLLPSKPSPLVRPRVGTVVRCNVNGGPLTKGTLGVCYELYNFGGHHGASFIFKDRFYDGFSIQEQKDMLLEIGHCPGLKDYKFVNVTQVERDYIRGVFDEVLHHDKYIKFYE